MNAGDIMSEDIIVAKENMSAEVISVRLLSGEVNGVPVVDDNRSIVGIVTAIDILKAIRKSGNNNNRKLNSLVAKDIMTPNPSVVKKNTPIEEVIDIMVQKEIMMVPVVEEDSNKRLIGVVSRADILREKFNEDFITMGKRNIVQ
jgi:CBS-domain-containing membrane protein